MPKEPLPLRINWEGDFPPPTRPGPGKWLGARGPATQTELGPEPTGWESWGWREGGLVTSGLGGLREPSISSPLCRMGWGTCTFPPPVKCAASFPSAEGLGDRHPLPFLARQDIP